MKSVCMFSLGCLFLNDSVIAVFLGIWLFQLKKTVDELTSLGRSPNGLNR